MFDALWNLSFMMFVALCCLLHNDVCRIMTFVTLICLSHYYVCCIMMSVALWRLSHYDVCRLWLLSLMRFNVMSLMTFVAVPDYACFPAPYYYLLLLPFFPLLAKIWGDMATYIPRLKDIFYVPFWVVLLNFRPPGNSDMYSCMGWVRGFSH